MSKKHDAVFDDVLAGLTAPTPAPEQGDTRFLKRSSALADRLSGEREEKTLHWIDPTRCRMWARHNRDYALLTEDNCRDLIDGIKAQGRQEFPAIVRRISSQDHDFEVVCGARRHYAVTWLRAHNFPQFKYLIEERDLTDEEAFRLADIENRDREDISDYERAVDYAAAIDLYYGGQQKAMAARLEVSPPWLSRYLTLAKMPAEILDAFASKRDIRERHARELKPLLGMPNAAAALRDEAKNLASEQSRARDGNGGFIQPQQVMKRLKSAANTSPKPPKAATHKVYKRSDREQQGITIRKRGNRYLAEFDAKMSNDALRSAFESFLSQRKD
ncbi:MAG: ParB/RepB/Spo0J family partition protein [Sedimentitalea sp.]